MKTITRKELNNLLGGFKSVINTPSRKGYGTAPNQFEIELEHGKVFKSYESFVGAKIDGTLYIGRNHEYSNTTSRHFGRWCGYGLNERRKGLKEGRFVWVEDYPTI